VSSLL